MLNKGLAASRLILLVLAFFSLLVHAGGTCHRCQQPDGYACNCEKEPESLLLSLTEYGLSLQSSSEDETGSIVVLDESECLAAREATEAYVVQNEPGQNSTSQAGGSQSRVPVLNREPEVSERAFVDLSSASSSIPNQPLRVNLPNAPQYRSLPCEPLRVNLPALPTYSSLSTSAGAAGSSQYDPAPLTQDQYNSYQHRGVDNIYSGELPSFDALQKAFAEALDNKRKSDERRNNMKRYREDLMSNGTEPNSAYAQASEIYPDVPFDEPACNLLLERYYDVIQTSLADILQRQSEVESLVPPVSNSGFTQWVQGDYGSLFTLLLETLKYKIEASGNQNVSIGLQIFNRYLNTIKRELEAYINAQRNQQISYSHVSLTARAPDISGAQVPDISGAQVIREEMWSYFQTSSLHGPATLAINFSGSPSPLNQGTVFMFMFPQGPAIIISPHLGILVGQTREAAFEYIMDFALLLSINKVSEKVTISKWSPSSR